MVATSFGRAAVTSVQDPPNLMRLKEPGQRRKGPICNAGHAGGQIGSNVASVPQITKEGAQGGDHGANTFGTQLVGVIPDELDHIFGTQMSELDGLGAELF